MIADERDYSLYLTNATMIYNLFRGFVKSFTIKWTYTKCWHINIWW